MRSFLKIDGTKVSISQIRGWVFSFTFVKNRRRIILLLVHLTFESKTDALLIEQEHVEKYETRNQLKSFGKRDSQCELKS